MVEWSKWSLCGERRAVCEKDGTATVTEQEQGRSLFHLASQLPMTALVRLLGQPGKGEREVFLLPPASPHLICYTQLPWCMDGTEDAIACVGTTGLQGNCSLLLAHLQQASPTPCTMGSWATVLLALPLMTTLTALSIMASTASSLSLLSVRWNDIFQHWQVLGAVPVKLSWDNVLEAGGWKVPQEGQCSAHPCVWGQLQAYLHHTDICAFEWTYLRCLKGFWNFSK